MSRSVELATILLTDLVKSTETAARLGPARADQLRDDYFGLLREAFRRFGGREFKNSGDGLWAAFASASAAVSCAVRIQQELDRRHRGASDRPHVRIGLSAGESTVDNGDHFGMPSIEAARLCDRALPDGILVAPAVRMLAGRCEGIEFDSVGELDLKGLPGPMEAFSIGWEPLADDPGPAAPTTSQIPLQGVLSTSSRVQFVGRQTERQVLVDALSAAAKRDRRVVLISGEAGIGKTRLLHDFVAQAHAEGAMVLYGRCEENIAVPYRPWVELLGHLVEHASASDLEAMQETDLAELGRLVPILHSRVSSLARPSGSLADKYLLFGAVARLVASVAGDRIAIVVIDDLHWADQETLQLLQHVVSAWSQTPMLVLGSYRDTDVAADHPLAEAVAQLHREMGVETISLKGLSAAEVTSLLEEVVGHSVDHDGTSLAHALWGETSGSPFFVVEVVRHLADAGTLVQGADGRWVPTVDLADLELPISVRAVIGQRVRRLGVHAQKVLNAAAVVGREFEGAIIAAVVGIDEEDVLEALEAATAARLIAEAGAADRFTFTHALVQHSLYHEMSMTRRARLHIMVADAIESLPGQEPDERAGELAHHLFAATLPAQQDRAIQLALQAGERAMRAAAPSEAVRWYQEASEAHQAEDQLGAEIRLRLGAAELQAGHGAYRERLLEAARVAQSCGADSLYIAAAIANYRGFHSSSGEVDHERVAVLETALQLVGADDSVDRARLLGTLAGELTFSGEDRRFDLCREASDVARRLGDPAVLLDAMLRTGSAMNVPRHYDERRERTEEILRLSADVDDPFQRFFAIEMHADSHLARGEMSDVRALDEERQAIASDVEQPALRWLAKHGAALQSTIAGDTATAEQLAGEALQIGMETQQPDATAYYGGLIMQIRLVQGRGPELLPLLEQAVPDNPGLPVFRSVLALCLSQDGRVEEARAVQRELRDADFPFVDNVTWLASHAMAAEPVMVLEDRAAAEILYDRLQPFPSLVACTRSNCLGSTAYYLGVMAAMLDRPADAKAHLESALEINTRLGSPYDIARTQVALAQNIRDQQMPRAQSLGEAALALAEEHEMRRVAVEAREFLAV